MIDEFFIITVNGHGLFHLLLEEEKEGQKELPIDLFAAFSSAIMAFTNQLGKGKLSKIELEDKLYVYQKKDDLIIVTRIPAKEDIATAKHVVALLLREFLERYGKLIQSYGKKAVRRDVFVPFREVVREIVEKCEKIAQQNPTLLENIPPSIEIDALEELSEFSDELVDKFPEKTILLTRKFQDQLEKEIMHVAMYRLGREVGKDIAKKHYGEQNISEKKLMKIMNEISISTIEDNKITLKICPFCRDRDAEEPYCDFVSGFIEGIYRKRAVSVKEIKCHAVGDKNCVFEISEKE
ncbi:MAG: V4R domain-containing protein [Asgard group archaeon]|nr:V4R domain-containing protein [Asgard group archaeon]